MWKGDGLEGISVDGTVACFALYSWQSRWEVDEMSTTVQQMNYCFVVLQNTVSGRRNWCTSILSPPWNERTWKMSNMACISCGRNFILRAPRLATRTGVMLFCRSSNVQFILRKCSPLSSLRFLKVFEEGSCISLSISSTKQKIWVLHKIHKVQEIYRRPVSNNDNNVCALLETSVDKMFQLSWLLLFSNWFSYCNI